MSLSHFQRNQEVLWLWVFFLRWAALTLLLKTCEPITAWLLTMSPPPTDFGSLRPSSKENLSNCRLFVLKVSILPSMCCLHGGTTRTAPSSPHAQAASQPCCPSPRSPSWSKWWAKSTPSSAGESTEFTHHHNTWPDLCVSYPSTHQNLVVCQFSPDWTPVREHTMWSQTHEEQITPTCSC